MQQPTPCPECSNIVELNDMLRHPEHLNTMICKACAERIEDEINTGEKTDLLGNVISWKYQPDTGLVEFSVNGKHLTTWSTEDGAELVVIDFMNSWNASQKATLEALKLDDEVAKAILNAVCDNGYGEDDYQHTIEELKHGEVYIHNLAHSIEVKYEGDAS